MLRRYAPSFETCGHRRELASEFGGDVGIGPARTKGLGIGQRRSQSGTHPRRPQILQRDQRPLRRVAREVSMNLDPRPVTDDQERRIIEPQRIVHQLPQRGVQVTTGGLVLPGEAATLPDVGIALLSADALHAALEAVVVVVHRQVDRQQAAQIQEMGLSALAFLQALCRAGRPAANEPVHQVVLERWGVAAVIVTERPVADGCGSVVHARQWAGGSRYSPSAYGQEEGGDGRPGALSPSGNWPGAVCTLCANPFYRPCDTISRGEEVWMERRLGLGTESELEPDHRGFRHVQVQLSRVQHLSVAAGAGIESILLSASRLFVRPTAGTNRPPAFLSERGAIAGRRSGDPAHRAAEIAWIGLCGQRRRRLEIRTMAILEGHPEP